MKNTHAVGLIIGLPAIAWFWHMTDWKLTLALFLILFANNLSQDKDEP